MIVKVIYFDNVFPEFKKIIEYQNHRGFELLYWSEMNELDRNNALAEADYFLVATIKITRDMINKAKNLKMIQKTGVGYDNIDIQAAVEHNVAVCNTPGANATGVAELTIAFILSLYRRLNLLDSLTKKAEWHMWDYRLQSFELKGKTHGFIGFGNIGKATAKLSQAFGTRIIYYDKSRLNEEEERHYNYSYMELDDVLRNSDVVSIHIALNQETMNLISDRELVLMKRNALLINVARGKIVDEEALFKALGNKTISGAAIDTWANEPIDADNPLLKLDNVIATPHIGAGTKDTLDNVLSMSFRNFEDIEDGKEPKFVVNDVNVGNKVHG